MSHVSLQTGATLARGDPVLLVARARPNDFHTGPTSAVHALVVGPRRARGAVRGLPVGQLLRSCAALRACAAGSADDEFAPSAEVNQVRS